MQPLSKMLTDIPPSMTLAVNDRAKAMQRAGQDVIILAGGDPDFATPTHIVKAAISAIQSGYTHYPAPMVGIPAARLAVADKLTEENHIPVEPEQIILTPGGKWALYLALSAVLNPGDEVLVLEPYWVSYPAMVRLTGGVPVPISLPSDDNFRITADRLTAHVTAKTKAIILNTPCNPTGRVLTENELKAVASMAQEADLYVIADEIYEKIVFDGRKHLSIAALPDMAARTLTVGGLTKSYAMTGWRLGWLAAAPPIIRLATRLNGQSVSCAATFTMHACVAALTGPQTAVDQMRDAYQARRDFMVAALNEIDGIECRSIEGAFYLFPKFTRSQRDSLQLADRLLQLAGVAGTPGTAFGHSGEKHVRFSIATAMSNLEKTAERIAHIAHRL